MTAPMMASQPHRAWLVPSLVSGAAIVLMLLHAVPRIEDGSTELRKVQHVMHDEALILERVWAMVDRGDLYHKIGVYPGFYPYAAGLTRVLSGTDAPTEVGVKATRWVSLAAMVLALVMPFVLLSAVAKNAWIGAAFTVPLAIHPEIVMWASRVHPDAFLILFDHLSIGFLALHVDRRGADPNSKSASRCLVAATIFAGLSASTKLVGVFIMVCIAAWIAWSERARPSALVRTLASHTALFAAVFALLNPLLFVHLQGLIDGFLVQHDRNMHEGDGHEGWWATFVGPRGLGIAGTAVALLGVARVARRPFDGVSIISAFGLFYLAFILTTVKLALPRYGFPAMWPLFFAGLAALTPSRWKRPSVAWGLAAPLVAIYLAIDLPAQRKELAEYATFFARTFSVEKQEVARRLADMARGERRRVVSAYYTYVPPGLDWSPIWTLDELNAIRPDTIAIVVDQSLRNTGGPQYAALVRGELGFAATSTIGECVIYEPFGALDGVGARPVPSTSSTTSSTP